MTPIIAEAFEITKELGQVTFVGAVAVILHTKILRYSQDIDFVIAEKISNEELISKQYKIFNKNGKEVKYTPRGYKIDMYNSRSLNGIALDVISGGANSIFIDSKKTKNVKVMSLESLIVSKFRANRNHDVEDLKNIVWTCYNNIQHDKINELAKDDTELQNIQNTLKYYRRIMPS